LPPLSKPKQMLMVVSPSLNFSTWAKEPWIEALHGQATPRLTLKRLSPCLSIWNFASSKSLLTTNWEPYLKALEGEYVIPGPGGDLFVTRCSAHGQEYPRPRPQSIPTTAAVLSAKIVVDRLLDRQR